MSSVRFLRAAAVLLMATGFPESLGVTYTVYDDSTGECMYKDGAPIDLTDVVDYGSSVQVKSQSKEDYEWGINCSLAFTYRTPALFHLGGKGNYVRLGQGDNCLMLFDGETSEAALNLRVCGWYYHSLNFLTTGPAILIRFTTALSNSESWPYDGFTFDVTPIEVEANYFMSDGNCSSDAIQVDHDTAIWLHTNSEGATEEATRCAVTLRTDPDYMFYVRVHSLSFDYYSDCLTFYNSSWANNSSYSARICGTLSSNEYFEFQNGGPFLTVEYQTTVQGTKRGATLAIESTSEVTCDYLYFYKCDDGKACYRKNKQCDGIVDCQDGSDEQNCNLACQSGVRCALNDGTTDCVPILLLCDGKTDCKAGEDENDARCDCGGLSCMNPWGEQDCIDKNDICDDSFHCRFHEDEDDTLCKPSCPSDFYCYTLTGEFECLSSAAICNSTRECMNNVDETSICDCDSGVLCETDFGFKCLEDYDLCNLYPHCHDGEDESSKLCEPPILSYWSSGELAGIFTGYAVFAVLVIAVTCLIQKKCKPEEE